VDTKTSPIPAESVELGTRERLISSTQELLWERGYVGTSPSAIQERSGVGQGSMYHHFKGKPALALAAIERNVADLHAVAESRFTASGTALERISAYLHAPRDILRGCQAGGLVQDPDIISNEELRQPLEALFDYVRLQLATIIQSGIDHGEFDPDLHPINTADMIAAVVQGGYVLARVSGHPEPFQRAVAGVIDMLRTRSRLADVQRNRLF
jgi:AcrR family transcriptional regulator